MSELKLADLGEGMHEAEIVEWLVKVGDTVKLDQTVVKVETDKAVVEIPSPVTGRVAEIRVQDGQTARVGDVLVVFDAPVSTNGDNAASAKGQGVPAAVPPAVSSSSPTPATQTTQTTQPTVLKQRVLAAPAVRKLAFELGVDLEQVTPSNPNGRVSIEDVKTFAERSSQTESSPAAATSVPAPKTAEHALSQTGERQALQTTAPAVQDERQPLTGLRKRIAEHMERSWRIIPHATAFDEVDGGGLVALRDALKPIAEKRGIRLTYIPLLIKLLVPLLKEFPVFNASLDEERREIIYKR